MTEIIWLIVVQMLSYGMDTTRLRLQDRVFRDQRVRTENACLLTWMKRHVRVCVRVRVGAERSVVGGQFDGRS